MKVPHVIAELVSEFSGFQHTPDFKASRSTGNFDEDPESGNSESHATSSEASSDHHHHHHSEHHGHSLYFGKHLKKHHSPDRHDPDTHSNHSGSSGKHAKHGLSVHFANLFHFGHHHDHEDHHSKPSSGTSTPVRKNSTSSQKHSIHITVGADEVPTVCATPPNELNHHHFVKNQNSSPNISRVASYSSLRDKLQKIKRTTSSDSETDFPEKKCSVTSYRVVGMSDQ